MNIPIPEVYVQATVSHDGEQLFAVVDGQQRLRTLLQFIGIEHETDQDGENHNGFRLNTLPEKSRFKGIAFSDLEGTARTDFFQYEICVRLMHTNDTKEVEDVFKRLNKFTMPLKAQELRNATYHGAFAQLSEQLADDSYWAINRIVSPAAIRRMADIEMMSDLLVGLLHGPQGGSAKIINDYYDAYEQYDDAFPDQARVANSFEQSKKLISSLFVDIAETRWGNRADFYSLFVAVGTALESFSLPKSHERELRDELLEFGEAVTQRLKQRSRTGPAGRYTAAIEKGSNDRARRIERHQVLMAILAKHMKAKRK